MRSESATRPAFVAVVPARSVPVTAEIGVSVFKRHHNHMAGAGEDVGVTPWADVVLAGLERLDERHLHRHTQ
jgi:hypothetical protein